MVFLGLPEALPSLVGKRFAAAKEAGALIFSATHLAVLSASGIQYQLRYCPALSKKPINKESEQPRGPKPDPFENPSQDLLIAEIPQPTPQSDASHILVLNKFPVIPRHFILATKQFRSQTDLLDKEDLEATFACLHAWSSPSGRQSETQSEPGRLFAFFNSGDESGASQPHRHLQFLPVEDMRDQQEEEQAKSSSSEPSAWIPLIDRVATDDAAITEESGLRRLPGLPFKHFALLLPPSPSPDTLYQSYLSLYKAAVEAAAVSSSWSPEEKAQKLAQTTGQSAISYNFAMTESAMMICPRRSETAFLNQPAASVANEGNCTGTVSLNGTILAGTLMVKHELEWDDLRNQPDKINLLLSVVGLPTMD